jgi:hypothetical protein
MEPEKMKLPELSQQAFAQGPSAMSINPQWVMDPPNWILRFLRDDVVREIYVNVLRARAEVAQIEANLMKQVSEVVAKR